MSEHAPGVNMVAQAEIVELKGKVRDYEKEIKEYEKKTEKQEKEIERLKASVSPPGSGSISPSSGIYDSGKRVSLTAIPSQGYQFHHWSGDASGTNPTTMLTLNSNKNAIANFVPIRYILSTSVSPSGGGSGTYDSGAQVTLTATPTDVCWIFDHWSGDARGSSNPITITMNDNKNITAHFTKIR